MKCSCGRYQSDLEVKWTVATLTLYRDAEIVMGMVTTEETRFTVTLMPVVTFFFFLIPSLFSTLLSGKS